MDNKILIQKIRQIEKLCAEVKQLAKIDQTPVIRAGIGEKLIIAEVSLPGQHKVPITLVKTGDDSFDYMNYMRSIHQAIGRIPMSVLPEGFKLMLAHTDDWDDEYWDKDAYSEDVTTTRKNMLDIFDSYFVKPELLTMDELAELEAEYDTLHSSERLGSVQE